MPEAQEQTRATHTPGPWSLSEGHGRYIRADCYRNGDVHPAICNVSAWPEHWKFLAADESDANARLIAAAPDMLSALKFIADRQNLMFAECSDAEEIVAAARAAIAKAEGR